mmetsp:Transcript_1574/g.5548  ORF Transcript_1574/g.5548 Transcript_1574/m.5548 type:complete len:528 (+) Transcript_1574:37-1620(+)
MGAEQPKAESRADEVSHEEVELAPCALPLSTEEAERQRRAFSCCQAAVVMSTFLVAIIVAVFVFAPSMVSLFASTEGQALSCFLAPPDVPLAEMHAEIRQLLLEQYFSGKQGAILMDGAIVTYRYDTDVEQGFRQESNFLYVTGYDQPNATVLIDLASRKTMLFVPLRPKDYAIWNGQIESLDDIRIEYAMDEVYYYENLTAIMSDLAGATQGTYTIFTLNEHTEFPDKEAYTVDSAYLQPAIYGRRELKTDFELELMRYSANVSAHAHELVMNMTQPGEYEYNVEGTFVSGCMDCGLTIQAYLPICASGNNSAILHYNANDREMLDGDLLLIDAGAEYHGYGTDITRSYPVNGAYSVDQAQVYNMVLRIQAGVIASLYDGMPWGDIQDNCVTYTCEELRNQGFITADLATCRSERVYYLFFPHGVSHYIGLDVHDRSGIASGGTLLARNVITVEPGIYFNSALLEPALANPAEAQYLVADKIQPFLDEEFGGVRIEDVVVIHESSVEVISNLAPKTIQHIEWIMNN